MKIKAYITHKLAENFSDCQDCFHINPQRHSIAVADGMSQSIFPQWWAEELVCAYTNGEDIEKKLPDLQKKWRSRVDNRINEKELERPNSAWRIIDHINFKKGAGSTLCGITFDGLKWSSLILGDTSIIIVDPNYHIQEIVNSNTQGFTNHPDYFDSMKQKVGAEIKKEGILNENSYILIVSDPLGELLELKNQIGQDREYIEKLISIESHEEFIETIRDWRETEHLHNDDTTCVVIQENGDSEFELTSIDDLQSLIQEQNTEQIVNQTFAINMETKNVSNHETNIGAEVTVKNKDLEILAQFCNQIIQLFQKHKKIRRYDFEKIIRQFPLFNELIKKYLS